MVDESEVEVVVVRDVGQYLDEYFVRNLVHQRFATRTAVHFPRFFRYVDEREVFQKLDLFHIKKKKSDTHEIQNLSSDVKTPAKNQG